MKVVAIIQARMGSTRLPGKVLQPLLGEPMLAHVVERAKRAATLDDVIVATTDLPRDNAIAELSAERGWSCWRGSEDDVLDRYYQAAVAFQADAIMRITSDCPLVDPGLIDRVAGVFLARLPEIDYLCDWKPQRTYPRGLELEIMTFAALEKAWREDKRPEWREHVTAYIGYHPELFRSEGVMHNRALSHHRWTVDEPADFALVERIYNHFGHNRFSWLEVLDLVEGSEELQAINAGVEQKYWPKTAAEWDGK